MLKTDFNDRMKQVLFNSMLSAYYMAFVPLCFAQVMNLFSITISHFPFSCGCLLFVWLCHCRLRFVMVRVCVCVCERERERRECERGHGGQGIEGV